MEYDLLFQICSMQYHLSYIPIFIYENDELKTLVNLRNEIQPLLNTMEDEIRSAFSSSDPNSIELIVTNESLLFGKVYVIDTPYHLIVGPIRYEEDTSYMLKQAIRMQQYTMKDTNLFREQVKNVSVWSVSRFRTLCSILYEALNHKIPVYENFESEQLATSDIDEQAVASMNDASLNRKEFHISYEMEKKICYCIENGLTKELEKITVSSFPGRVGFSSPDSLRQMKNSVETLNTICLRAAIKGGLDAETAYSIGEVYATKIEMQNTLQDLYSFPATIRNDYCRRVNDLKYPKTGDVITQKALKYIHAHIMEKIVATDIADYLNISKEYLSAKFKNVIHKSIPEYIAEQKVREAKTLLKFSDRSLVDISNYLSFSSQSYFQNTFKKIAGITPSEYRQKNRENI